MKNYEIGAKKVTNLIIIAICTPVSDFVTLDFYWPQLPSVNHRKEAY